MKKKINILLIIIVVGLWGYIGYRVINNLKKEPIQEYKINNYKSELLNTERDTFAFVPLKRDPFLNRAFTFDKPSPLKKISQSLRVVTETRFKSQKDNVFVPWPQIEYYGYIKSAKNQELAVLKVNNQLLKLHSGESNQGIQVKKVFKDSIFLSYNKQQKTIKSVKKD